MTYKLMRQNTPKAAKNLKMKPIKDNKNKFLSKGTF